MLSTLSTHFPPFCPFDHEEGGDDDEEDLLPLPVVLLLHLVDLDPAVLVRVLPGKRDSTLLVVQLETRCCIAIQTCFQIVVFYLRFDFIV